MIIYVVYSVIVLFATVFGAIAGLGGGVIIKPLFDMIGYHDAATIGFLSSVTVFTMCIVSIIKQLKMGFAFSLRVIICISIGSLLGGGAGDIIFNFVSQQVNDNSIKVTQASLLALTFIIIIVYTFYEDKNKNHLITNRFIIFISGFCLGLISVFLGIGGGPLNVALLMYLFSYSMKEATIYSIATIFFSQLSKLVNVGMNGGFARYDLTILPVLCITAIIGGFIGTTINQKLGSEKIASVYTSLLFLLLAVSTYNIITNI